MSACGPSRHAALRPLTIAFGAHLTFATDASGPASTRITHLRHPGNAKLNRLFGAGEHSEQVDGKALEAVLL
jgi:hypothetical protein